MFEPACRNDLDRYERAVDSAIAVCGGDLRGTLRALIIANEFLEDELRRQSGRSEVARDRRNVA